jgi:ribosomal-protein-alanine acetyltransferase
MPARFAVRVFRWSELDRILELEHASFRNDAYDRNLFAEFFHKCGDLFLVAIRRSRVCGYSVTCIRGERAELVSIAVDPAERGRGAASALLAGTVRRLRRRHVSRFGLMVRISNVSARTLYERHGFSKVRRVPGYYEDGEDGLLMTRSLT